MQASAGISTLSSMANSILSHTRRPDVTDLKNEMIGLQRVADQLDASPDVLAARDIISTTLTRDAAIDKVTGPIPIWESGAGRYTVQIGVPHRVGCYQAGLSVVASLAGGMSSNPVTAATNAVMEGKSWTPYASRNVKHNCNIDKNEELVNTGMTLVGIVASRLGEG